MPAVQACNVLPLACKVEPIVGKLGHTISEDLQVAQQRLHQLRAHLQANRSEQGTQQTPLSCLRPLFAALKQNERPFSTTAPITQLPPHLGWESAPVTRALRQNLINENSPSAIQLVQTATEETAVSSPHPSLPKTVKVYPDIAIGLLQHELVAVGRLWLLLQVADSQGRGWTSEVAARKLFTLKRAQLRFCGARQLRNLLVKGDDILWTRGNGRIWLRSVAKVAFTLDIPRLQLRPVAVPVRVLAQTIGTVRAHLYATFHSSRTQAKRASQPIARTTVAQITQVQPRTQRRYERKARVIRQQQFAIGSQATVENQQARAWQQGQATFEFKDFKGKQGRAGSSYVAWQLPNSYVGPHAQQPKGRQKQINRALTDLFMQGITGNGQRSRIVDGHAVATKNVTRRFFGNGRLAAKSYLKNPKHDHYWPGRSNSRYQLWLVMAGSEIK